MHVNKPDFYSQLTPEMQKVADYIRRWNADHPPTEDYLQDYKDERKFWNEGGPIPAKVVEETVPGPNGPIPVRLHYPVVSDKPLGVTVYLHGGSFMLGNNDTHSRVMRIFAQESNTVVIGVDYRLAPAFKFPSWVDETVAVIRHFHQHGAAYGLDPEDMAVCGDSAGAFMTLSAFLYLRDHGEDISYIRSLILYYGAYGMMDSPSYRRWGNDVDGMMREEQPLLYRPAIMTEQDAKDPYFDMFSNDLTHDIPPSFICCGTIDPLVDNSTLLYEILQDKGQPCELKLYPGVMHSFLHYSRMMEDSWDALRRGGQFVRDHKKP